MFYTHLSGNQLRMTHALITYNIIIIIIISEQNIMSLK